MMRTTLRACYLLIVHTCLWNCGGNKASETPAQIHLPPQCAGDASKGPCSQPGENVLGSDWHPDPDGDGIATSDDLCPNVYDPAQRDEDADGLGDLCDPDLKKWTTGTQVLDLHAEHVTPYGGWFSFTSPQTSKYGRDYVIAWSQVRADLESAKGIRALPANQKSQFRVYDYAGKALSQPQVITAMMPQQTYFVSVTALNDDDEPVAEMGSVVEIRTGASPTLHPGTSRPRVFSTPAQLTLLQQRAQGGDKRWKKWAKRIGPSALEAARDGGFEDFEACISAAVLYHVKGDSKYKQAALRLIKAMHEYWSTNQLSGNQLRWANSNLAICSDLMWNDLPTSDRNAIVSAYLQDDEPASIARMVDTDEFASITRTWVIDGLVGCEAPGLDAALSARACALLDRGLRAFYGVQLVKARRNEGFFAQSGGNLPDGIGYGLGTSKYWLQTFYALSNAGGGVESYAPWIWHNFLAMQVHALTPARKGLATFGDLDSYDNFAVEANSLPVPKRNGGSMAMYMGLLERGGMLEHASHAKGHLERLYSEEDSGSAWPLLLFDHDGLATRRDDQGIPTAFLDSGMGMFYDRTDWSEGASFLTFRAGWSGADHSHEDIGSFQFYRKGAWLTNEALGYNGPASQAQGHNVPALEVSFEDHGNRVGQFALEPAALSRVTRVSSSRLHSFIAADVTGAYTSSRYHSFLYKTVERHIFWLKPTQANPSDRLFLYDVIESAPGKRGTRAWQLHINRPAALQGAHALVRENGAFAVTLLVPKKLSLRQQSPQGRHSQYPGEIYTSRLIADAQSDADSLRYLAFLQATDATNTGHAVATESKHWIGAQSGSDLLLFPRTPKELLHEQDLAFEIEAEGPITVWWTGLEPNSAYTLRATRGASQNLHLALTPGGKNTTDAAGVLMSTISSVRGSPNTFD